MKDENLVEETSYRNFTIKIVYDTYPDSPDFWGDDNLFLVGYHRDFWVERDKIITKEEAQQIWQIQYGEKLLKDADDSVKDLLKKYWCFGLEAYIHSGVHLSLAYEGNYPDRRWDVSHLGLVLVAKSEFSLSKSAEKMARELVKTWNRYLSGAVYGFIIYDKYGTEVDSCYGFYDEVDMVLNEAKDSIDGIIEVALHKHVQVLKIQIRNHTPLDKRTPFIYA